MLRSTLKPQIGIWGPRESGKTSYLAMLWVSLHKHEQWDIQSIGEISREFGKKSIQNYYQRGIFPPATRRTPNNQPLETIYRFSITGPVHPENRREKKRTFELTLMDVPGGIILEKGDPFGYFSYLRDSTGIFIMMDIGIGEEHLQREGTDYGGEIYTLLERLSENTKDRKLKANVAFCLTKMDLDDRYEYFNCPEEYVQQTRPGIYQSLKNRCHDDKLKFFSVSVVGRYPTLGGERPNIVPAGNNTFKIAHNSIRKTSEILSEVLRPVIWLFERSDIESSWF